MATTTRFTDPAAVDAWDSWFRWRNADGLRDRTIDATWWRVAAAIAAIAGNDAGLWANRYVEAFSRWQLLPDERLLRTAGTGAGLGLNSFESPCATLNVAAFVIAPSTSQARFDGEHFARVAALAVRLLDDALVTMRGATPTFYSLRIGVLGFADTLHLLGIPYNDAHASDLARAVGAALAEGTLRGTTELANERAPIDNSPAHLVTIWRDRGMPDGLIEDAMRRGVRHARLTAIQLQPRLAMLANAASDALEPPPHRHRPNGGDASMAAAARPEMMTAEAMMGAQMAIRAAIQPWIDAPIEYPLAMIGDPDPEIIESYMQLAGTYGLCEPTFRCTYQP